MRQSGDTFINTQNNFTTFLNDRDDLPRLSILQNYGQIIRIMNNTYIKGHEFDKKYKNRSQMDVQGDEEYVKFKEDETNTKKMSTILMNINSPKRKTFANGFPAKGQTPNSGQ